MKIMSDPEGRWCVWSADCLTVLRRLSDASVDAVVTDPPYELGFMGKKWDASGIAYNVELWGEVLRVLKPGGHLLAFGGTRTYHRMACAVEDAGFEIRDCLNWVHSLGFPKSHNISIAIDKAAGVMGHRGVRFENSGLRRQGVNVPNPTGMEPHEAITDAARQWEGWGTALKPAHEPIVLARKPLIGAVAANVLEHGTGALNIDGTRVPYQGDYRSPARSDGSVNSAGCFGAGIAESFDDATRETLGRWPANLVHDGSDEVTARFPTTQTWAAKNPRTDYKVDSMFGVGGVNFRGADSGSAARFFTAAPFDDTDAASFLYCAKASKRERNAGVPEGTVSHPTVKPLALMRWLVRLVTPPNGIVLDPFTGSGTTLVAALLEGKQAWGCEMTEEYLDIIEGRIGWAIEQIETTIEGTR